MDFQTSRSQQFALDAAAASVLSAWENSQRHPNSTTVPMHRPPVPMSYTVNGFPISPVSPSSSPSSSSSGNGSIPMLPSNGNGWMTSPSSSSSSMSVSEFEMLQLRRGGMLLPASAIDCVPGVDPVGGAQQPNNANNANNANTDAHGHSQFNFDFDFTLPPHDGLPPPPPAQFSHLSFHPHASQLLPPHHQQQQKFEQRPGLQTRVTPPLPTPTTPSTSASSTLFSSPPVTPPSNTDDNASVAAYSHSSPTSSCGTKRSSSSDESSSPSTSPKKPRTCMSVKDFVPPDVTGLSKREARLVKNRAAAFLSRQRKREEFEMMEIRVAELERENAGLRQAAEGVSPVPPSSESAELELLRMQLAASRQREAELVHRLELLKHEQHKIKREASEPSLSDSASSDSDSPVMTPSLQLRNAISNPKTGASLGLMVLLCALPSLMSEPRSTLPSSSVTASASQPSLFFDATQWHTSSVPPVFPPSTSPAVQEAHSWEMDVRGNSAITNLNAGNGEMDIDYTQMQAKEESPEWQKLELGLGMGLEGEDASLEVSFATSRTNDGKIRVRVQPSLSPLHPVLPSKQERTTDDLNNAHSKLEHTQLAFPSPPQSRSSASPASSSNDLNANALSFSFSDSDTLDSFFGAGSLPSFDLSNPPVNSNLVAGLTGGGNFLRLGERHRVRIALHSLPRPGVEGGEWQVEVR